MMARMTAASRFRNTGDSGWDWLNDNPTDDVSGPRSARAFAPLLECVTQ